MLLFMPFVHILIESSCALPSCFSCALLWHLYMFYRELICVPLVLFLLVFSFTILHTFLAFKAFLHYIFFQIPIYSIFISVELKRARPRLLFRYFIFLKIFSIRVTSLTRGITYNYVQIHNLSYVLTMS